MCVYQGPGTSKKSKKKRIPEAVSEILLTSLLQETTFCSDYIFGWLLVPDPCLLSSMLFTIFFERKLVLRCSRGSGQGIILRLVNKVQKNSLNLFS